MVMTITDILNLWNEMGVFSYVIPFLLIFAVVYAILEKSGMLGDNKPIMSIVSAAIGLLALQFDYVSNFFAVIFPRFGIGLSIFLVLLILIGFFYKEDSWGFDSAVLWIGWLTGIGVVLWAISSWDSWHDYYGFGGWFSDYIWSLIILGAVIAIIFIVTAKRDTPKRVSRKKEKEGRHPV
ncbi:MAG: hypothetical protein ABIF88_00060 [archaeon]